MAPLTDAQIYLPRASFHFFEFDPVSLCWRAARAHCACVFSTSDYKFRPQVADYNYSLGGEGVLTRQAPYCWLRWFQGETCTVSRVFLNDWTLGILSGTLADITSLISSFPFWSYFLSPLLSFPGNLQVTSAQIHFVGGFVGHSPVATKASGNPTWSVGAGPPKLSQSDAMVFGLLHLL